VTEAKTTLDLDQGRAHSCAFAISVRSGLDAVRKALRRVMTRIAPLNMDVEELNTVELVLAEVLNNIVEHAYPSEAEVGLIHIFGRQKPNGLHVRIVDRGRPMPDGRMPLGAAPSLDLTDLPEGGFGWFMIQDLAKDVQYRREGDRNVLTLRLPVAMQGF
jgi:serine/threonine-protein kinase RsbW